MIQKMQVCVVNTANDEIVHSASTICQIDDKRINFLPAKQTLCKLKPFNSLLMLSNPEIVRKQDLFCQNCHEKLIKRVKHEIRHTKRFRHKKGMTLPNRRINKN